MLLPEDTRDSGQGEADSHANRERTTAGTRRRRWLLALCAIAVVGIGASVAGSLLWRSSVRAREKQTFETAAANVSGTLETSLRRDTDFVRSVRAVMSVRPNLSAS